MSNINDRVGAILGAKNGVVEFLGYGVFVGNFELPEHVGGLNFGQVNPKIELDNGKEVWGCECWWGSEEQIKEELEKYDTVIEVDIEEVRKSNDENKN